MAVIFREGVLSDGPVDSNAPKYELIADDIRRNIEDGSLGPGERLPTVVELCEIYGVSKATVRKAMERLTELGLVSSRRGSGTFVKNVVDEGQDTLYLGVTDKAAGFTAEHAGDKAEVTSIVYDFSIVIPPKEVARRLDMAPDDFAYYDVRVRCLDGVPVVIERTYMPLDLVPGLKRHHLEGSIYRYLREDLGLTLKSFHRILRAVAATAEEAERLNCEKGAPLFEIEQLGFLDSGEPFEYSISRNVGQRYELHDINVA